MKYRIIPITMIFLAGLCASSFAQETSAQTSQTTITPKPSPRQLPLENNPGYILQLASVTGLVFTKEPGYGGNFQPFSGISLKNSIGRSYGLYLEAVWGTILASAFGTSNFRYRGFGLLAFSAGPFVDLSLLSGFPGNLQVGLQGGAAFGHYRESNALFYFPVIEPSCTLYRESLKKPIAFFGSLSVPLYLKPQAFSVGLGIKFGIAILPFPRRAATGALP